AAAAVRCANVPARSLNRRAGGSGGTKLHPSSLFTIMVGQSAALNCDSCALQAVTIVSSESTNFALAQSVRQSRITPLGGGEGAPHDDGARAPSFPNLVHRRCKWRRRLYRFPRVRLARPRTGSCRCAPAP